jgi:hypothetical protein
MGHIGHNTMLGARNSLRELGVGGIDFAAAFVGLLTWETETYRADKKKLLVLV